MKKETLEKANDIQKNISIVNKEISLMDSNLELIENKLFESDFKSLEINIWDKEEKYNEINLSFLDDNIIKTRIKEDIISLLKFYLGHLTEKQKTLTKQLEEL